MAEAIDSLFKLESARSHAYSSYNEGRVAFVTNGFVRNGVVGCVEPKKGDKVFKSPAICISAFCEATVQQVPFIARGNGGSGLVVLEPLVRMPIAKLLWYAAYLNQAVRWRFSFGRMVTVERLSTIKIHGDEDELDIDVSSLLPCPKEVTPSLDDIDLTSVPLTDIFVIRSGDYHKAEGLPDGTTPLVSCGMTNNGVVRYCDVQKDRIYRNALTVAYNGSPMVTKYHPYPFAAKDDVAILLPVWPLKVTTLLFVQMMLARETWRYSYGRKCFKGKLSRMSVSLPTKGCKQLDEDLMARIMNNTSYWDFIAAKIQDTDA